jgi:hypothetical protein
MWFSPPSAGVGVPRSNTRVPPTNGKPKHISPHPWSRPSEEHSRTPLESARPIKKPNTSFPNPWNRWPSVGRGGQAKGFGVRPSDRWVEFHNVSGQLIDHSTPGFLIHGLVVDRRYSIFGVRAAPTVCKTTTPNPGGLRPSPHDADGFWGPPVPPGPQTSTISGLPKNHVLRTPT